MGLEAAAFLRAWLEGRHVDLEADPLADEADASPRLLWYVADRGRDVNAGLVEQGHARVIRTFRFSPEAAFLALQRDARLTRRGSFCRPDPTGAG